MWSIFPIQSTHTHKWGGRRKCLEGLDVFITLIVVTIEWVYVRIQTHLTLYIKYIFYMPIILQQSY